MQPALIRVIVIDANTQSRQRTVALIATEPDIEVAGVARSGTEGLRLANAVEPSVVLLSPNAYEGNVLDLIRHMVAEWPSLYIILITRSSDAQFLQNAILAGAKLFLPQPPGADKLLSAIRASASSE